MDELKPGFLAVELRETLEEAAQWPAWRLEQYGIRIEVQDLIDAGTDPAKAERLVARRKEPAQPR